MQKPNSNEKGAKTLAKIPRGSSPFPFLPHHTSRFITQSTSQRIIKMTRFRPCIDLHAGSVKQIVGGTLSTTSSELKTNFTSEHPAAYYAELYKKHNLAGAHVIMLGLGNEEAAGEALKVWKGGMQVGGGITEKNAHEWIERGAEKVSSLSILFMRL